jgi:ornithine--oxo-acid transaminase
MQKTDYIQLDRKYGAQNYQPLDIVLTKGHGVWVYDVDGNQYLDCLSAYSALNQGHIHPKILQTMIEQAQKITLTSRAFYNDQLPVFYRELSELTGFEKALPMNSGAEAVETAIKLARKWAVQVKGISRDHAEIIVFEGNFHGRTITLTSASSEPSYRGDFGPFTPGFVTVPYGDIQAVKKAINQNTTAILAEPIQGEGGVIVPPEGFLRALKEVCISKNILLIFDEIQTGLGRTGKLFAYEHENARPDILIIGKALSGGFYPVSAVLADHPVMDLLKPGEHGSTFGGNPLATAIARTSLKVIVEENLVANSAAMGEYLMEQLAEIPSPHVKDVRGKGLLIGVELKPETGGARPFCEALAKKGILAKETRKNVIRFAPPLIIDKETIDWAITRIREVLLSQPTN